MIVYIAGYILLGAFWSIVRINALLGQQKNREAAVYGGIMGVSIVIGSLLIARVNLPSFVLPYQQLLEPVAKRLLKQ